MMDLQTIRALAQEIGRDAERIGKQPRVLTASEIVHAKRGNVHAVSAIPALGDFLPKGWARVSLKAEAKDRGVHLDDNDGFGAYFVSKGWSVRGREPALSVDEFVDRLKPGLGYAIVEEGQFQIKIGAFAVRTASTKAA